MAIRADCQPTISIDVHLWIYYQWHLINETVNKTKLNLLRFNCTLHTNRTLNDHFAQFLFLSLSFLTLIYLLRNFLSMHYTCKSVFVLQLRLNIVRRRLKLIYRQISFVKNEWTIDLIGSDIIEIRMRYIKFFPDAETRRGEINQSRVQCVNREL